MPKHREGKAKNTYVPSTQIQLSGTSVPTITLLPQTSFFVSVSENRTVNLVGTVPYTVTFTAIPAVSQVTFSLSVPCWLPLGCCSTVRGFATIFSEVSPGILQNTGTTFLVNRVGSQLLFTFRFPLTGDFAFWAPTLVPTTLQGALQVDVTYTF